jgi:hypothetical protein
LWFGISAAIKTTAISTTSEYGVGIWTAVIRKKYSKKLVLAISSLIKYNKHRCHGGFSQTLCSATTF